MTTLFVVPYALVASD